MSAVVRGIDWVNRHVVEGLGLLLLLSILAFKVLSTQDLAAWDESTYLSLGSQQAMGAFAPFTEGGTYYDMYWIGHLVVPEPISLYFLGRVTSATVFVLGVWFAARQFTPAWVAWMVAAVAVTAPATRSWPGVGAFAGGFLIASIALVVKRASAPRAVVASALAWVAAGARPEILPVALLMSVLAVVLVVKAYRRSGSGWRLGSLAVALLAVAVVPVSLIALHGAPIDESSRSWAAFVQHYALRNAAAGADPWFDVSAVIQRDFGSATSVPTALVANPLAMARHVVINGLMAPVYVMGSVIPVWLLGTGDTWLDLAPAAVLLGILATASIRALQVRGLGLRIRGLWVERSMLVRWRTRDLRFWILAVACTLLIVPVLVVYPRTHYLTTFSALVLVMSGVVLDRLDLGSRFRAGSFSAMAIVMTIICLQSMLGTIRAMGTPPGAVQLAQALRSLDYPVRMLTRDIGLSVFVPGMQDVPPRDIAVSSFPEYLTAERINVVNVNGRLLESSVASLPQFQQFIARPEDFGFTPLQPESSVFRRLS